MHEFGIAENIVKTVNDEVAKLGKNKVLVVNLVIGELSAVFDESIQLYFDLLSEGKPTEGSKLSFKRIAAKLECKSCKHTFGMSKNKYICPKCGGSGKCTEVGKEFYIESVEVE